MVIKNIKSFTAIKLIDAIIKNPEESRRSWMLDLFEKHGKANKKNYRFQFWQHENHPILLDNLEMYNQRLVYLYENPVKAGFVREPQEWLYSSTIKCFLVEVMPEIFYKKSPKKIHKNLKILYFYYDLTMKMFREGNSNAFTIAHCQ